MAVNWNFPPPRPGLNGAFDRFIGPGATRAEIALELAASLLFGGFVVVYALANNLGWSAVQYIAAALLAFDIAGGVVTNATSAAKRWYHRQGQGFRQHFGFVAIHVAQLLLMTALFRGMDWGFLIVMYGYLLVSAALILSLPLYLHRPVALALFCGALLINQYVFPPPAGMEWFVPFLFLKLLVSHLLREEPYQPD